MISSLKSDKKHWGKIAIINLINCDKKLLKSKTHIQLFPHKLCRLIKMKPYGETLLKKFGKGKLEGYSLMQFIETSSITAHFDEFGNKAFIDVFSCKNFDEKKVLKFSKKYFKAKGGNYKAIYRE